MNAHEESAAVNAQRKLERDEHLRRATENWEGLAIEVLESALSTSACYFDDVQIAAAERLISELKAAVR